MKVHEIFQSISGEIGVIPQGAISWFIRFQGCNLRCHWCDTKITQNIDKTLPNTPPKEIAENIPYKANVIITGGEPLLQPKNELIELVNLLKEKECLIQIETNGTINQFIPVCHIFDYKLQSSGIPPTNGLPQYITDPLYKNWIKFVVINKKDIKQAIHMLELMLEKEIFHHINISLGIANKKTYLEAMKQLLETKIPLQHIVFNTQIHKFLKLR